MYLAASFLPRRRAHKTPMASSARIDELRKKFEENPRRYFAPLANEYRKAGDIEQAISICKEYLPQQPGHMSGHIVYGQALYEARQYEEARTVFETALALDPENLIALRHLGDIALIVGDIDGARVWYGRVLEADPRNEEIQAQLKSLESVGPAAAPTPMSTPAVESAGALATPPPAAPAPELPAPEAQALPALELTTPEERREPAPISASSAPTVVIPAIPIPTIERTVEIPATPPSVLVQSLSTTPTAEIALDHVPVPAVPDLEKAAEAPRADLPVEKASGFEPTSDTGSGEAPVAPASGLETTPTPPTAVPPIDSFTLDGLETTSMSTPPEREAAAAPTGEPTLGGMETPTMTPALAEAPAPEPPPDSSAPEPPPAAFPELEAAPDGVAETQREGETAPVAETSPVETPETAPPPDAPGSSELTFLDVGDAPSAPPSGAREPEPEPAPEPAMAESKPFVTETMAELYEQQGHRDEALRVYRALLDQRPNDAHIRSRIEQLEGKRGPTIRELLARVAMRRPPPPRAPAEQAAAPGQSAPAQSIPAQPAPAEPASQATRVASEAPTSPPAAARAEEPKARNDALGQLFGNAAVGGADENAAITLAAAFSNGRSNGGSPAQPLSGTPAHPASKDLSLDAVFGSQSTPQPAASSFSFDQFFSERATAEHPASGARNSGEGQETKDDVAKFTQWLEGLKQR
jgi:tetratricopeptide (TPR) repeat protein